MPGFVWNWAPGTADPVAPNVNAHTWAARHGSPKRFMAFEVSTEELSADEAYDHWCATVFHNFMADPRNEEQMAGFYAHAAAMLLPRGEFFVYQSDAISGTRTVAQARTSESRDIDIGLVLAGMRHEQAPDGSASTAMEGDVFVYDPTQPTRVAWTTHEGAHLKLRRSDVEKAIGQEIPEARRLTTLLDDSELWPFLRQQLLLLAKQRQRLSAMQQAAVLDNIIELALVVLSNLGLRAGEAQRSARKEQFIAAQQYIEAHLSDPDLGVATVAEAINYSRSSLYRLFAEHDLTVASYILERRLQRFRKLLLHSDEHVTVATLAQRCGVRNASGFNKKFEERFGIAPGDIRR